MGMKTWSLPGDVEIKALPDSHVALCVALVTLWYPPAPSCAPAMRYCTDDHFRFSCLVVVVTRNSSHQQRVTSQMHSILRWQNTVGLEACTYIVLVMYVGSFTGAFASE